MSLREYFVWLRGVDGAARWYVILLLIKPLLDGFYFLKDISVVLSPLYILGIGVPLGVLLVSVTRYKGVKRSNIASIMFTGFSVMVAFNAIAILIQNRISMEVLQVSLKITLPVYIMYYSRRYLSDETDQIGIVYTVLLSCVIPAFFIIYENVVGPIRVEESRGYERYSGIYADVFNYSIYTILAGVSLGYYHLRMVRIKGKGIVKWLLAYFAIAVVVLFSIYHIATWVAFIAIMAILMTYILKNPVILIMLVSAFALLFATGVFDDITAQLEEDEIVSNEIEILRGERPIEQAGHGRMARWSYQISIWKETSALSKLFGGGFDDYLSRNLGFFMIFPHNDYLRIMFTSGIFGLILYIMFLIVSLVGGIRSLNTEERFMYTALVVVTVIYSISMVPTIYTSFVMPVYAMSAKYYGDNTRGRFIMGKGLGSQQGL